METKENNKLIAEFLFPEMLDKKAIEKNGLEIGKNMIQKMGVYLNDYSNSRYHTSWDWLMPVVEKIWNLGYSVDILSLRRIHIHRNDNGLIDSQPEYDEELRGRTSLYHNHSNISCLYEAIAEFIEWHNKQTN